MTTQTTQTEPKTANLELDRLRRVNRLNRKSPAGEVVLAYLSEHTARLTSLAPAVLRGEPDSVHQMRVAARRLRSTLQAFPAVLPKDQTRRLRDDLKWLGQVLGDARDHEVLSARFERQLAELPPELVMGPAQARIRAHFAPREADAGTAIAEALGSARYAALTAELDRLLDHPPFTDAAGARADDVLPHELGRAWRRTRRRMERADETPPGEDHDSALHETRKAAKRARYAAEAVQPVYGKSAKRLVKRLKAVQSTLGDHHDAAGARAAAREIAVHAHLAGENAFSFGLLQERAHAETVRSEHQARDAWKRARKRVNHGKTRKLLGINR